MYYGNRTFIDGERYEQFLEGVRLSLNKQQAKKIELVRLSVKKTYGLYPYIVQALFARKERAPGAVFEFVVNEDLPKTPEQFTLDHWRIIGSSIAHNMGNWIDNDVEFDRSEAKAQAIQYDVWKTSEWDDVAEDFLKELELQYRVHLGGKIHWLPRKAITDWFAKSMTSALSEQKTALTKYFKEQKERLVSKSKKEIANVDS